MHAKYEVSISYGSKVIAKVKVDNRQTDKQKDRQQDKNYMPPITQSGGIKTVLVTVLQININKICQYDCGLLALKCTGLFLPSSIIHMKYTDIKIINILG